MNRIYKLKFDKRRNELVVVSEITAGMGKEKSTGHIADLASLSSFRKLLGTLTPVALLTGLISGLLPAMVLAADLPTGGQIVGGQGSISTSGNQMTIHQQTQNMVTNWHSFDIGKNNTVQFVQPDSSSVALNRVTGASGSQIMGTLKANGQVFILNPNGVLFGKNARVDVGGLVASTKNISTADFMKGQYTLSGEGNPGAQVINQGSLTTSKGGYIVLAGERVSNSGTVTTPGGKTVLAAGKTVTLQLDNGGLTSVSVNGSVVNALVENRGLISASNGQVYLTAKGQDMLLNTVVNNSGTVEAKGLVSRAGEIVLDGGDSGVVSQSGQLLADSQTGQGGKITLEGQNIHLAGGSLTSATGKTGGGEVYVGGGWQGKDSRIRNASKVVMDKTATVDVSATDAGNGGTAVLWSEDYTNFRGTVLAKGGAQSGNGGRVETSSHRNLQAYGEVDASARAGHGGDWLLDPTDVTIVSTGGGNISETGKGTTSTLDTDTDHIFSPNASGAAILNSSIVNQLNAGTNVTVKTSGTETDGQTGNITVNADIVKTAGADTKLTLLADNNIATADRVSIGATTGKLNLDLLAGNTTNNASITLGKFINISLNGGDFLADAANPDNAVSLNYSNNGQIQGGNVTLNLTSGLSGYAYKVQADNDLTINGPVSGDTGWGVPLSFIAGGNLEMNSPTSISLRAAETTNGGGRVVISGDKGVSLSTADGNILLSAASAATNSVNVSSVNGAVAMSAGGNLTLVCATVTSGAGQDVTLNAAGKNSARVNITGSTINSNGGNISVDHAADGQAMTMLISGSTLNAIATDNGQNGNITLRAYNPNVDLSVAELNTTVRNGASMIDIGNSSVLRGKNITTETTQEGSNSRSLPIYMHGATLEAVENITLRGVATGGATPAQLELRGGGNTLNSVSGNITLQTDNGTVLISGVNATAKTNITSGGNVTISAIGLQENNANVTLNNTEINAKNVSVTVSSGNLSTLSLNNAVFNASKGEVALSVQSPNVIRGSTIGSQRGGLILSNSNSMTGDNINISVSTGSKGSGAAMLFANTAGMLSLNGTTHINIVDNSDSRSSAGFLPSAIGASGRAALFKVSGGDLYIDAKSNIGDSLQSLMTGGQWADAGFIFELTNSDLHVNASSVQGAGARLTNNNYASYANSLSFKGSGNVDFNVTGTTGLIVNRIDAGSFVGRVNVSGVGTNGPGIVANQNTIVQGSNISLSGVGTNGVGVSLTLNSGVQGHKMNLSNSSITGVSNGGNAGIFIKGNNVAFVNGILNGTVTSGNGAGIVLEAGNNFTLDGASVIGKTENGTGISVNGTLKVNNTSLTGIATGSGNGVMVEGSATLTNATVSGETQTGTGAVVSGKLTADDTTQVTGKATQDGGTGVTLNGTVTGGKVDGVSVQGTGLQLADNAVVTNAALKGVSTSGSGVAVTGNISLDDTTAAALNATSGSGAGLSLEDNANVSIVSITTVTQEKKDSDGNTVTDATGNPVMETITMTTPVATPVTLAGISQSGSGVATSGNVSISGVVLNGSATTAEGTGATLGGNLTIADNISGITVNAVGNGTALVVDSATIKADGYTSTGKGFVINASTSDSGGTAIKTQGNNQLGDVTLNGTAINGGTAVELGGQVSGGQITGTSDSGQAVVVSGEVSVDGTDVKGHSDTGTGLNVSGNATLTNATVSGETQTGTGAVVSGKLTADDVSRVKSITTGNGTALVLENATLQTNGYGGTDSPTILASAEGSEGIAIKIKGNNQLGGVPISGEATSSSGGTGVSLGGRVSSPNIKGTAVSGTAVIVTDGTIIDGGIVHGRSQNGTGLSADGNVNLNASLISGSVLDSGTGVSLKGNITGGRVSGVSGSGGDGVLIVDSLFTDTEVNGVSQSGTGVKTQGNVTLQGAELRATSENGVADLDVSGALYRDQYSVINADRMAGQENIHVLQPDTPPSPGEGGAIGNGGNTTPDTGDSGGVAGSDTGSGESGEIVTPPPGGTAGGAGNNGNTGSATGGEGSLPENNVAQRGEASGPDIRGQVTGQMFVSAFRQQAVDAQVTRMNQATPDGFHSAATPVVPVTGYQAKPQNVEISLCDEDSCQPESLDAARPAEGVVTSSGK
ncbi:filamentous hemagglutinin N-terminal domain-containing protein [Salmonella enterica]|nr:filamentous hemagglutinin N-terminal domain-containing protein [Salmonella enterica]